MATDTAAKTESILNVKLFSRATMSRIHALMRLYFSPVIFGLENIDPHTPYLFIGNHNIHGMVDAPLIVSELYRHTGVLVRSMADHFHFVLPGWREYILRTGGVPGTRTNCKALMDAGYSILIYPGGAREVFKNKGEAYQLIWKQRTGFVRMAMEHRYRILPFASVGADDSYTILVDSRDIMNSIMGKILKKTGVADSYLRGGEFIPPLTRGLGPTLLPRPERFYFSFGKPIDTAPYYGQHEDKEALFALRNQVEAAIKDQLLLLFNYRDHDRQQHGFLRRLLTRF